MWAYDDDEMVTERAPNKVRSTKEKAVETIERYSAAKNWLWITRCSLDSFRWTCCLFSLLFLVYYCQYGSFAVAFVQSECEESYFFATHCCCVCRTAAFRLTPLFHLLPPVGPFGCQFSLDSQSSKISSQAWFGWFATCPCFGQCHESASRRAVTRGTISQGTLCVVRG